jgi:hypothetical protein
VELTGRGLLPAEPFFSAPARSREAFSELELQGFLTPLSASLEVWAPTYVGAEYRKMALSGSVQRAIQRCY